MKIIETTFERLPRERLVIGFEGENLRATVRIDCASVFAEYPNATPALIVKPLFADAYPVVVDRNGTDVDWLITSEILSFSGDGEIQLVFYKDEVICKSAITKIRVCRSLTVTGEMPDPVVQWIENANRKLAEVDAQIVELEGMVDTATDAAERAEQSASTASTKAEQAAGSAAIATEKATEATNAAGTATAKAAEAQTAAQTATEKANAAAESERIATAKAGDATTAAGTATAKAEQATEAARTATEKAGDASASATAAHASATDAAESATAASASETAAKASETAAGASATQAAQSAQGASTATQTATQKAAEATQSATNAATSATNAATSAETASTKAGEAAQSAQAVEETAEQLAESLEQIDQNKQDIADLDERKANIDGYYPDMTVGNAEQLNSSKFVENSEPYTLRTSGGTSDIGNREYLDAVVGGTVAWNQAVRDSASENSTNFAPIVTVTDAVEDAAEVKVKIEPVQDLHGYDHPWPAGGGKNKLNASPDILKPLNTSGSWSGNTYTINGGAFTIADDGSVTVNGTFNNTTYFYFGDFATGSNAVKLNGFQGSFVNTLALVGIGGSTWYTVRDTDGIEIPADTTASIRIYCATGASASNAVFKPMIRLASETDGTFAPYSNICPITGWDSVKVTRTGKNLIDPNTIIIGKFVRAANGSDASPLGSEVANASWSCSDFIPALPSTLYTQYLPYISKAASAGVVFYDADKAFISGIPTVDQGDNYAYSFTTSANCRYLRFSWAQNNGNDVLLSFGTATAYEPYSGNTYDITLPTEAGTVYGGELTVNADGSGSLVVDRAMVDLGTLAFSYDSSGKRWQIIVPDIVNYPSRNANILAEKYAADVTAIAGDIGKMFTTGKGLYIYDIDNENAPSGSFVYPLATPITYTLTASQIRTLLGTNNVWSDAGQTALTYTGTDEHLTLESGKKYLARLSGTDSMLLGSGQEIMAAKGTDNVFDLTQMFGTAVADYVYGQGAGFFRKWFGKQWYPYNAGELLSVEGLQSHDMVGFNAWDEQWESGSYSSTGQKVSTAAGRIRSANKIRVLPSATYYMTKGVNILCQYDSNGDFVSFAQLGVDSASNVAHSVTMGENTHFITFASYAYYGNTYKHDICISLVHNGSRNGEYAPYEKHSYPLDSTVVLRGIPKVGANGVYWDGDRYLPDGTVERRYGVVDLGTIDWRYRTDTTFPVFVGTITGSGIASTYAIGNITCSKYVATTSTNVSQSGYDKTIAKAATRDVIYVQDSSYTDAATFKAAMQGVLLVYELETPTIETAQPYHSTQWVSDWGTEEFVSTSIVPVGSETRYPANLRDKLQHLPDAASGNGSYLITQTDGQMVLTPFPAPPSSAGNYVLKATVVNGVATYTWEAAT